MFFVHTLHCASRAHCPTCRDRNQRQWRDDLRKAFDLPNDETDFECPYGLPWGFQGQAQATPTLEQKIKLVCGECPEQKGCVFAHHSPCRRRRMLQRPGVVCPATPPKWGPITRSTNGILQ